MKNFFKIFLTMSIFFMCFSTQALAATLVNDDNNNVYNFSDTGSRYLLRWNKKVRYMVAYQYTDNFGSVINVVEHDVDLTNYDYYSGVLQAYNEFWGYDLYENSDKTGYLGHVKFDSTKTENDPTPPISSIGISINIDELSNALNDVKNTLNNSIKNMENSLINSLYDLKTSVLNELQTNKNIKDTSFQNTSNLYPDVSEPSNKRFIDNTKYFLDKGDIINNLPEMPDIPDIKDWEGISREDELLKDTEMVSDKELNKEEELEKDIFHKDDEFDLIQFDKDDEFDLIQFDKDDEFDLDEFEKENEFDLWSFDKDEELNIMEFDMDYFDSSYQFKQNHFYEQNHFYDITD